MAQTEATYQFDDIVPPRLGKIWAQAVDGTARPYNIALLPLGGKALQGATDHVIVTMSAEGGDIFCQFNTATSSVLDDTIVNAAGTPLTATTMASTMAWKIPNGTSMDVRMDRFRDTWIVLKCSGVNTATLRLYASSRPEV